MKKKYEEALIDIIAIAAVDVIRTSNEGDGDDNAWGEWDE